MSDDTKMTRSGAVTPGRAKMEAETGQATTSTINDTTAAGSRQTESW